jgi:hypothetical protein
MRPIPHEDQLRAMTKKQLRRYVRELEAALDRESRRAGEEESRGQGVREAKRRLETRNLQLRETVRSGHRAAESLARILASGLRGGEADDECP